MLRIELDTKEVLAKVKANRQEHEETFNEAVEGYKAKAVERLTELIEQVQEDYSTKLYTNLNVPKNFLSSYDRAIRMLEASNSEKIVLDESDYSKYMDDDWEWKDDFRISNAGYTTGKF